MCTGVSHPHSRLFLLPSLSPYSVMGWLTPYWCPSTTRVPLGSRFQSIDSKAPMGPRVGSVFKSSCTRLATCSAIPSDADTPVDLMPPTVIQFLAKRKRRARCRSNGFQALATVSDATFSVSSL